jgi:hypothetical protein
MSKHEIDIMWQQAMRQSIEEGEMFTRYHFAKLVAAKEREACAKLCESLPMQQEIDVRDQAAAAIRARGQA